ncbi:PTBP3 protein, partial [Crotophaga sulcirostris]|nr:PTBP3 protein [Crotophaga sulcirostris]
GNEKKKFKGDRLSCSPSRVLHLRKVPDNTTEAEIISLGSPFGEVDNVLLLKRKNQALLEMASEECATAMMKYYTSVTAFLRKQPIQIQYSHYKELTFDTKTSAAMQDLNARQSRSQADRGALAAGDEVLPGEARVLRIIVENLVFPVTVEALYQIFSRFGLVLKIITFTKNHQFQVLLQYSEARSAYYAKRALDGQHIYTGCCTLHIGFSKLSDLKIKYNNDKSRDFTRTDLPSADGQPPLDRSTATVYLFHFEMSTDVVNTLPGLSVPATPGALSLPSSVAPGQMSASGASLSPVLLVSNLNPEVSLIVMLWISTGLYGDVHRVKILFNKKDNALIQMADAFQALKAISHLNGQKLYGSIMNVTLSKYQTVQLPREGQTHSLTKDYSNSPLHRFKKPGSKSFQNIFPPSATLHLSNIPPSVTADSLKDLFTSTGSTVKAFKFFQKGFKMALIQLGSVEEAFHALIELHNRDLGEKHRLQISFAKYEV